MRAAYFYLMKDEPLRVGDVGPRHAAYCHAANLPGYQGGPFADRSGGLITFECDSSQRATDLVAGDPFIVEGLVETS